MILQPPIIISLNRTSQIILDLDGFQWYSLGRSSWANDVGAQDKFVSFPKIMPRKILWGYPGLARDSRTKSPLDLARPLLTFLPGGALKPMEGFFSG